MSYFTSCSFPGGGNQIRVGLKDEPCFLRLVRLLRFYQ